MAAGAHHSNIAQGRELGSAQAGAERDRLPGSPELSARQANPSVAGFPPLATAARGDLPPSRRAPTPGYGSGMANDRKRANASGRFSQISLSSAGFDQPRHQQSHRLGSAGPGHLHQASHARIPPSFILISHRRADAGHHANELRVCRLSLAHLLLLQAAPSIEDVTP